MSLTLTLALTLEGSRLFKSVSNPSPDPDPKPDPDPEQWLKEQLRLAVDERKTGAAGAAQLAGLQAAAAAAGVDTTSPSFAAAAEAAPAQAAAAEEELVCVSLVETATDEWCSSFCAKHSCPESMCKCEAAGAPAQA